MPLMVATVTSWIRLSARSTEMATDASAAEMGPESSTGVPAVAVDVVKAHGGGAGSGLVPASAVAGRAITVATATPTRSSRRLRRLITPRSSVRCQIAGGPRT